VKKPKEKGKAKEGSPKLKTPSSKEKIQAKDTKVMGEKKRKEEPTL
jgi:superfamily II RNA helicase